jgi:hypothetical protein
VETACPLLDGVCRISEGAANYCCFHGGQRLQAIYGEGAWFAVERAGCRLKAQLLAAPRQVSLDK